MLSSHRNPRRLVRSAIVIAAALVALAGCGGDDDESSSDTTAAAATTTEAEDEATDAPTTTEAESTTTAKTEPPTEAPVDDIDPWRRTALNLALDLGATATVECPPNGEPYTVWGTDDYTNDSSICTAAVHAGLITFDDGGDVLVEITPGEDAYFASQANGVTTSAYGAWGGSFIFPDGQP